MPAMSFVAGPITCWTKDDTAYLFFPLGGILETRIARKAKAGVIMSCNSGDCIIRPAVRVSNDKITWVNPTQVGSASRTSDGTTYGTAYDTLSATVTDYDQYRYVQAGIWCKNNTASNTATELCFGSVEFDFQE